MFKSVNITITRLSKNMNTMNKQQKKFEKELISALTLCCEQFKEDVDGFLWLTHTLNFSNIAQVFENNHNVQHAIESGAITTITNSLTDCLKNVGITLKKPKKHITFDSEENCDLSHQGNWQKRLSQRYH